MSTLVTVLKDTDSFKFVRGNSGPHVTSLAALAQALQGVAPAIVAVTTVGAGVLTAAGMAAGVIMRSGPTGAYTDAMDSATNIVAAFPSAQVGGSFRFRVVNGVAYKDTVTAGTGNTIVGVTDIAASTWRDYVGTFTAVETPAVTITGISSGPA